MQIASGTKRRLFFPRQKLFFHALASGIFLLIFAFSSPMIKAGGTGRNFAAEVLAQPGAGVPARDCSEVAAVCGTGVYTFTCTQRFFAA